MFKPASTAPKEILELEGEFTQAEYDSEVSISFSMDPPYLDVEVSDRHSDFKKKIEGSMSECKDAHNPSSVEYEECLMKGVESQFGLLSEKISVEQNIKSGMAEKLRGYTCADPNMTTSIPVHKSSFTHRGHVVQVDHLLDTPHAKVWLLSNFVTDGECNTLKVDGNGKLRDATVSDGVGGDVVSEHRRAKQASYDVRIGNEEDPLFLLKDRIYAIVNHYTGYGLTPEGQEGFTTIQYDVDGEYR